MTNIASFLVGLVFAIGLGVAGMTQPARIIGFLDFFGDWDATLAFVMIGAAGMYAVFYWAIRGAVPVLAAGFKIPVARQVDGRLLVGAAMFGIGWGLAGLCPAPALVSLGNGVEAAVIFVGAMVAGMYGFAVLNWSLRRAQ